MPLEVDGLMWPSGADPCGEIKKERDELKARVQELESVVRLSIERHARIKELEAERDALKARVDGLEAICTEYRLTIDGFVARVAELEDALRARAALEDKP